MPGKRTLVVLEKDSFRNTHSMFFANLESKGCTLTIVNVKDKFEISRYGEYLFDDIVIILESDKKYNSLSLKEFGSFIDFHGSVFVMFNGNPSDFVRNFAGYSGVEIDAAGSSVVDFFTSVDEPGNTKHTKFVTSNYARISRMVGALAGSEGHITYRGMGMRVDPKNVLAIPVVSGDEATTSLTEAGAPQNHASSIVLVAAIQTRSNNRVVFAASADVFSDAYYMENPDNRVLGDQLSLWTFKFAGYLKASNIQHYKYIREEDRIEKEHEILVQSVKKPNLPTSYYPEPEVAGNNVVYRIKDELYYSVNIQEFDGEEWKPYAADDVQIEFVMLDPYVRKTLSYNATSNNGDYSTIIRAPDVYSIYKFRLFYQRQGVSLINENTQVDIRPFKHNEFPRFILAAYPYYTAAIVVMLGFVLFVFVFLFFGEKVKQE
ncbi:hypothetical protein BLSTO_01945 [Blastocystis sp. subtype 1]